MPRNLGQIALIQMSLLVNSDYVQLANFATWACKGQNQATPNPSPFGNGKSVTLTREHTE